MKKKILILLAAIAVLAAVAVCFLLIFNGGKTKDPADETKTTTAATVDPDDSEMPSEPNAAIPEDEISVEDLLKPDQKDDGQASTKPAPGQTTPSGGDSTTAAPTVTDPAPSQGTEPTTETTETTTPPTDPTLPDATQGGNDGYSSNWY